LIRIFRESEGKKVISGGTTARIIAEGIGKELSVEMETLSCALPPTAVLEGADLVTEGVLTLSKTMTLLEQYTDPTTTGDFFTTLRQKNGASRLARMIIEDCTRLNIWMGSAVNPAHQDPDSSIAFNIKRQEVERLVCMVRSMGREVELFQI
ncbi:MAG TPA: serine/threonine-protein phosphatase, partial [Clostridiaceae bacterium]|nr:serine/threonine-protein phosphatase [Clostridiaceae bacterium]